MTDRPPNNPLRALRLGAVLAAAMAAGPTAAHGQQTLPSGAPATLTPELVEVRDAPANYADPVVAIRHGCFPTLGRVVHPNGGIGVHFLHPALIGPTSSAFRPQFLVCEPAGDGRPHLVAAEWFIPRATGITERSSIFGQALNGPMEGHEPLMPRELHHYDRHVWLVERQSGGAPQSDPSAGGLPIHPLVACQG